MPFDFAMPEETRRLLELLAQQQPTAVLGETQELPPEQPVEPAQPAPAQPAESAQPTQPAPTQAPEQKPFYTASDIQKIIDTQRQNIEIPNDTKPRIDNAVLQGAQRPQAPNPHELGLLRGILANKLAYNAAGNDTERQTYRSAANLLRNQGRAAGYNLGGFGDGANGYSLAEATNNLASREAQDMSAVLGQSGYYSMGSDQYYEQQYERLREMGYSVGRSKRVASSMAREYQANRVAFLDGLYNGYGRGDTALSNQILALMGKEDPTRANFYAQTNPSPLNDYNQANEMAQTMLTNSGAMDRLKTTMLGNIELANVNARNTRGTYAANKAVDNQYEIEKEKRNLTNLINQADVVFTIADEVLSPEEAKEVRRNFLGVLSSKLGSGGSGGRGGGGGGDGSASPEKVSQQMTNVYNAIQSKIKDLRERDPGGTNKEVQAQIADLEARGDKMLGVIDAVWGIEEPSFIFTGNMEEDEQTLDKMWLYYRRVYPDFRAAVDQLMDDSRLKDNERKALRKKYIEKYYSGHR